ncbi:hypothetical protein Tco_1101760 [Tanacetum coccineum]
MVTSLKEKNGATPSPHLERALYSKLHEIALGLSGLPRPGLISNGLKARLTDGIQEEVLSLFGARRPTSEEISASIRRPRTIIKYHDLSFRMKLS